MDNGDRRPTTSASRQGRLRGVDRSDAQFATNSVADTAEAEVNTITPFSVQGLGKLVVCPIRLY